MPDKATFKVEDAIIIYRNFSGKETKFNKKGDRNFAIVLTDEAVAKQMLADGWNVKFKEPRDEDEDGFWHIPVAVKYDPMPPRVYMLTSTARTLLTESTVEIMDIMELVTVDLICSGYDWEVNGKTGRKAYLKTMYATIYEDELDMKYGINPVEGVAVPESFTPEEYEGDGD